MCLGESTTQGEYPVFLEEILNQSNAGIQFSVIDKGCAGTTTSAILERLIFNLDQYYPDMVVAMMGVNDWGTHIPDEASTALKGLFFVRSLRTYKLARLFWLHLLTKAKKMGLYKADQYNQDEPNITEDSFKKAIALDLKDFEKYHELGRFYQDQAKFSQAEDIFKKVIELFPKNNIAFYELARLYRNDNKLVDSEAAFKKAIMLESENYNAYLELGWLYRDQGKFSQAEEIFKKAADSDFDCKNCVYHAYAALSVLYEEMGKPELAEECAKKANRGGYYNLIAINNYRKLKAILDKRKIRLVCLQYAMRSIAPLKEIFSGREGGIIFVDNEKIFKDAVKKEGSNVYFRDMFAGDFGHCTEKGNRVLAGNIASAILKEVLGNYAKY
jgi:tetratricopeptide (TPR) repeat protein